MSVSISIPEELYEEARAVAESYGLTVEQVLGSALTDQLSAWRRLRARSARGDRTKFLAVLDNVPDVEPEEYDRL